MGDFGGGNKSPPIIKSMCLLRWETLPLHSGASWANPSGWLRSTTRRWNRPTTPSLEALQAYSLGRKMMVVQGDCRVAISSHRIVDVTDTHVTVRWKDYAHALQNITNTFLKSSWQKAASALRRDPTVNNDPRLKGEFAMTAAADPKMQLEDIMECLPIARTVKYAPRQVIYGPDHLSTSIYLVISGRVGISRISSEASEVLLDIVQPEELFGESVFIGPSRPVERATALEIVELMKWDVSVIEDLIMKRPRLAMALLQILALRSADLARRVASFSIDTVQQRLARSLIQLSERLGTPHEDGSVRMMPVTHEMLARYVGTSRELVTHNMTRFRDQGYVSYSRRGIRLFREALSTVFD
jgi:CRP/FNR family transcriptional regulator, cyclic AMP receptor protein